MLRTSYSRLVARTGTSAIFAVAMLLSNVAPSQAISITPDSVNPWQHIVDCWGAMVAGDPVHATDCSPGQPGSNTTLVTPVPGGGSGAPCTPPVKETLAKPAFSTYDVASLDDSIAPSDAAAGSANTRIAVTCGSPPPDCASLAAPAFSSHEVASLDDSIVPRNSVGEGRVTHLASCVTLD